MNLLQHGCVVMWTLCCRLSEERVKDGIRPSNQNAIKSNVFSVQYQNELGPEGVGALAGVLDKLTGLQKFSLVSDS